MLAQLADTLFAQAQLFHQLRLLDRQRAARQSLKNHHAASSDIRRKTRAPHAGGHLALVSGTPQNAVELVADLLQAIRSSFLASTMICGFA
ncbi:MAG: hypothetical protein R2724_23145 [Bryobacterales bacterium]